MSEYEYGGYTIKPSTRKNKKYDVFNKDGKYLLSFGDSTMQHYFDKFGAFSHLDHLDKERKRLFWLRHKKTSDKKSPRYWLRFLW